MNAGLAIFLSVVAVDLIGVITDLVLRWIGTWTITMIVQGFPVLGTVLGAFIVAVQFLAPLGLMWHFWGVVR